jgi:hypothetical protein
MKILTANREDVFFEKIIHCVGDFSGGGKQSLDLLYSA